MRRPGCRQRPPQKPAQTVFSPSMHLLVMNCRHVPSGTSGRIIPHIVNKAKKNDLDGSDYVVRYRENPQSPWQLETLRTGRARIEEQGGPIPFGLWLVRVAEDADVKSFSVKKGPTFLGEFSSLVQNVPKSNPTAT